MTGDTKELETTEPKTPKQLIWKNSPKQQLFIEYWLTPTSETFGNSYRSALKAGFKSTYAYNIMNVTPKWLLSSIDRLDMQDEHIKAGIQQIALAAPNSRSPDDTRLKAYETLGKIRGMIDKPGGASFTFVQPILGGKSVQKPTKGSRKDVIEGEVVNPDELIPDD